jgi:hypothetical protein
MDGAVLVYSFPLQPDVPISLRVNVLIYDRDFHEVDTRVEEDTLCKHELLYALAYTRVTQQKQPTFIIMVSRCASTSLF